VTIRPAELSTVDGDFAGVETLPERAVYLQATPSGENHGPAGDRRVFTPPCELLPAGTPRPIFEAPAAAAARIATDGGRWSGSAWCWPIDGAARQDCPMWRAASSGCSARWASTDPDTGRECRPDGGPVTKTAVTTKRPPTFGRCRT
jgi:hypothetical protein